MTIERERQVELTELVMVVRSYSPSLSGKSALMNRANWIGD